MMDLKKILLTTVAGLFIMFLLGFGFYSLYYQDLMVSMQEQFPNVMNEEPNFAIGLIMTIVQAFLLSMYFDKAGIKDASSGAVNGAWISGVIWMVANGNMMAMTKLTTMDTFMVDMGISIVMGAIAGAVMAVVMGRLSK